METWFIESISNGKLLSVSYSILRCDRDANITGREFGGGVLIGLHEDIKYDVVETSSFKLNVSLVDSFIYN